MRTCAYFLITAFFLATVFSCGHKGKTNNNVDHESFGIDSTLQKTSIRFDDVQYNFGQIKEGEKVVHVYEVTNTGKSDLLLLSVQPSCGCTTPKWDKRPIRPGKKGHIEVSFDSKGRPGAQHKTITVVTNTEIPNTVLYLNGEVLPVETKN